MFYEKIVPYCISITRESRVTTQSTQTSHLCTAVPASGLFILMSLYNSFMKVQSLDLFLTPVNSCLKLVINYINLVLESSIIVSHFRLVILIVKAPKLSVASQA